MSDIQKTVLETLSDELAKSQNEIARLEEELRAIYQELHACEDAYERDTKRLEAHIIELRRHMMTLWDSMPASSRNRLFRSYLDLVIKQSQRDYSISDIHDIPF